MCMERGRCMFDGVDTFHSLVECSFLQKLNVNIFVFVSLAQSTLAISGTMASSNLSLYFSKVFWRCRPFSCERTVPRTAYPRSRRVCATHIPMKPEAPETRTFAGGLTVGIVVVVVRLKG